MHAQVRAIQSTVSERKRNLIFLMRGKRKEQSGRERERAQSNGQGLRPWRSGSRGTALAGRSPWLRLSLGTAPSRPSGRPPGSRPLSRHSGFSPPPCPLRGVATGSGVGRSLGWSSRYMGGGCPCVSPLDSSSMQGRSYALPLPDATSHLDMTTWPWTLQSPSSFHPLLDSAESEMVTSR